MMGTGNDDDDNEDNNADGATTTTTMTTIAIATARWATGYDNNGDNNGGRR